MNAPIATILISTRNRCDELCATLESATNQSADCEILVIDDGSTDDTSRTVPARFPQVRYVRHDVSAGYIVRRNEGAKLASAPIIVSIDDDAVFTSPETVGQAVRAFSHPRVGAVAIPFVNVKYSSEVQQPARPGGPFAVYTFIGTAHALRRDLFLRLGGYRTALFHQGEEQDYCIRMLAAGFVTVLVVADPIHHFESPRRDFTRWNIFGRRNSILFAWHNIPAPEVAGYFAASSFKGLRHGWQIGQTWTSIRGLVRGFSDTITTRSERRPLPRSICRLFRRLKKHGPIALSEIEAQLPAPIAPELANSH